MVNDDVIGVEQHGYTAVSGAGTAGTVQVLVLQVLVLQVLVLLYHSGSSWCSRCTRLY